MDADAPALGGRGAQRRDLHRAETGQARRAPGPQVVAKPTRRQFTAEYRLRIIEEANRCTRPGEVGRLLHREGLYTSICRHTETPSCWLPARTAGHRLPETHAAAHRVTPGGVGRTGTTARSLVLSTTGTEIQPVAGARRACRVLRRSGSRAAECGRRAAADCAVRSISAPVSRAELPVGARMGAWFPGHGAGGGPCDRWAAGEAQAASPASGYVGVGAVGGGAGSLPGLRGWRCRGGRRGSRHPPRSGRGSARASACGCLSKRFRQREKHRRWPKTRQSRRCWRQSSTAKSRWLRGRVSSPSFIRAHQG